MAGTLAEQVDGIDITVVEKTCFYQSSFLTIYNFYNHARSQPKQTTTQIKPKFKKNNLYYNYLSIYLKRKKTKTINLKTKKPRTNTKYYSLNRFIYSIQCDQNIQNSDKWRDLRACVVGVRDHGIELLKTGLLCEDHRALTKHIGEADQ